jgi:rhodanese-related sulfurtransferase
MKKKRFLLSFIVLAAVVMPLSAWAANYVKPDQFKQWLDSGKRVMIIDIQPADDFEEQHFKGSIETNAFPAKTAEDKKKLDKAVAAAQSSKDDIVVVCPRGKSGASNTYEYLMSKGLHENRLSILEGGIAGWPYPEMFVQGR